MLRKQLGRPGRERVELDVADAAVDHPTRHQGGNDRGRPQVVLDLGAAAPHHDRGRFAEPPPMVQVQQLAARVVCDLLAVLDDHVVDQQTRGVGRTLGIDLGDGQQTGVARRGARIALGAQQSVLDAYPSPGLARSQEA